MIHRPVIRHVLLLIALIALGLLWWRPTREIAVRPGEAWLLTPGAEKIETTLPVFRIGVDPLPDAEVVPDLATLVRRHPEIRRLRVAGEGLPAWEWDDFPGEVDFAAPAEPVPGIRYVSWPRRVVLGEALVIEGAFQTADREPILYLSGPGGEIASLSLDGEEFLFQTRPRSVGRFDYRLSWNGGEEILGVEVVDANPPTVLWLEDAPSFEARHFKKWLVDRGGRIVIESRTSRDRTRFETGGFTAAAPTATPRDEASLALYDLALYDLVILDRPPDPLFEPWIKTGGGILQRIGENDDLRGPIRIQDIADLEEFSARLHWPGVDPLPALSITPREVIGEASPLVSDAAGRVLAAWRAQGRGRVAVTLVHDTFRWRLEGEEIAYGRFWTRLLDELARRDPRPEWRVPAGPLFIDEPIDLVLTGVGPTGTNTFRAKVVDPEGEATPLFPRRNTDGTFIDNTVTARWWPRLEGWHRIEGGAAEGVTIEAAVNIRADGWDAWRAARALDATRRAALRATPHAAPNPIVRREGSRGWWWCLFLAASMLLWTIERLRCSLQ